MWKLTSTNVSYLMVITRSKYKNQFGAKQQTLKF